MVDNLLWVDSTTSTNDLIRDYPPNTILLAACQTAGRGKYGRQWVSERGSLYFTYKKPVKDLLLEPGLVPLMVGIGLHQVLTKNNKQKQLLLKWPNDLLNEQAQKIGGILLEQAEDSYLIGVGLNTSVNQQFASHQAEYQNLWLAKVVVDQLNAIAQAPPENILYYWHKHAWKTKGEWVHIKLPNNSQIIGKFKCVGTNGALHMQTEDNQLLEIHSGIVDPKSKINLLEC